MTVGCAMCEACMERLDRAKVVSARMWLLATGDCEVSGEGAPPACAVTALPRRMELILMSSPPKSPKRMHRAVAPRQHRVFSGSLRRNGTPAFDISSAPMIAVPIQQMQPLAADRAKPAFKAVFGQVKARVSVIDRKGHGELMITVSIEQ